MQIICAILLGTVPTHNTAINALAQASPSEQPALQFFLDEPPVAGLSGLPPDARNAFIARVRIVDVSGFGGRERPFGNFPPPKPYSRLAEIEVTATLQGQAPACQQFITGCHLFVEFGSNLLDARTIYPLQPDRKQRQYHVVSFFDGGGTLTLLGFPISEAEYATWYGAYLDWITRPPTTR